MKYILFIVIFFSATNAFADSEYYCAYFGGVMRQSGQKTPIYGPGFEGQPCQSGDALTIISYDHTGLGRESMYLSNEISELCDLKYPVTVIGPIDKGNTESGSMHAVCTYLGKRREIRK